MQQLLNLLPIRRGHFRYESGHHGDVWLELDQLFVRPTVMRPVVDELAARLAAYHVDAVCGPLVGGALVAQMVAETLGSEFYFTQSKASIRWNETSINYRLPATFRRLASGKRVAIVDDAINAGSAVHGSLAELNAAGARVVVVGTLIALGDAEKGFPAAEQIPLESIVSLRSELWPAADCPLCAASVPFDNSGPPV